MEGGVGGGMGEQLPEPVALVRRQPGPVPAQPAKMVGQPRRELGCLTTLAGWAGTGPG